MSSLKSLAASFLVATAVVWSCNTLAVSLNSAWLGLCYLLVLFVPLTSGLIIWQKKKNPNKTLISSLNFRSLLFSIQGVALAFWMFDISTTFYAINITKIAYEVNPLGWPWGILGAMAYYLPTIVFSYLLLYKMKSNIALIGAVPITFLTLIMATMNLNAGIMNYQFFSNTAALVTEMRIGLLSLLVCANVAVPVWLKRIQIR